MEKSVGLILQGGGSKGAYQVGSLMAISEIVEDLYENTNPFKAISGVSVGSINAAHLATSTKKFKELIIELKDKWLRLKNENVYNLGKYGILSSISNIMDSEHNALFSIKPLEYFLNEEIYFPLINLNSDNKELFLNIHAYSYTENKNMIFTNDTNIKTHDIKNVSINVEHIIASSSVPYVFKQKRIKDGIYGDGGLQLRLPSRLLIKQGCDKILGMSLDLDNLKAMADILFGSIFPDALIEDFHVINKKNERVNRFNPFSKTRIIKTFLLRPEIGSYKISDKSMENLPKGLKLAQRLLSVNKEESNSILNYIVFDKDYAQHLIETGYKETMKKEKEIYNFFTQR